MVYKEREGLKKETTLKKSYLNEINQKIQNLTSKTKNNSFRTFYIKIL